MTYQEARLRLANHANLAGEALPATESFAYILANATATRTPVDIGSLAADIIACLEVVNRELNGPVPSERMESAPDERILEVVYPVSCIITDAVKYLRQWSHGSLFDPGDREALAEAVYRIAYAWNQVLAGDIDDLLEGADLE